MNNYNLIKKTGYKIIKTYLENNNLLFDVAVFSDFSIVFKEIQCPEKIFYKINYEYMKRIRQKYKNELEYNFINELIIIL